MPNAILDEIEAARERYQQRGGHACGLDCDDCQADISSALDAYEDLYFSNADYLLLRARAADRAEESDRRKGLTFEVVGGELRMSIGIDVLALAAEGAPGLWPRVRVLNEEAFARAVASSMQHDEAEDGSTPTKRAMDRAFDSVVEDADPSVEYEEHEPDGTVDPVGERLARWKSEPFSSPARSVPANEEGK
jgi:hypothetical protein